MRPYFFYRGTELFACRLGEWKAHFRTQSGYGQPKAEVVKLEPLTGKELSRFAVPVGPRPRL